MVQGRHAAESFRGFISLEINLETEPLNMEWASVVATAALRRTILSPGRFREGS